MTCPMGRWLEARQLRTDDGTPVVIRKRIGAALIALRRQGVARAKSFRTGSRGGFGPDYCSLCGALPR